MGVDFDHRFRGGLGGSTNGLKMVLQSGPKIGSSIVKSADCNLLKNFHFLSSVSLQFFQAGSLLCLWDYYSDHNTLLNRTLDTSDLLVALENMTRRDWFRNQNAVWMHKGVEFVEILTQYGWCFSVNFNRSVYNLKT